MGLEAWEEIRDKAIKLVINLCLEFDITLKDLAILKDDRHGSKKDRK